MTFANDLHQPGSRSPITRPIVLAVEGRDMFGFFLELLRGLGLDQKVELRNFGGVGDLPVYLEALASLKRFETVVSIGIARDCEADPHAAFESVKSALGNAGLPQPRRVGELASGPPQTVVILLPDADSPGMLETLLWRSLANQADPAAPCVEEFLDCIDVQTGAVAANLDKSRVHAFIASKPRPYLLLGQAVRAGYFPLAAPDFDPLKKILCELVPPPAL